MIRPVTFSCALFLVAVAAMGEEPAALPHARWLENGLIDAGGTHEGFLFTVRRGGQRLDARKHYDLLQSEEAIRALASQGIEVFHTHLYKGFGMAAEKAEMDDTVRAAAIAHRYGMKADTYVQWNTLMYETFFAEEPRAKDWVQRDALGQPIMLNYGYQQSFRYRPCFANQDYLDYLKKVVRFAVEEAKTDFIHFDNFDLNAEPESCHCPKCVAGFRAFLRRKYTPAQRRERLGFENVDYVNPPAWNHVNPAAGMRVMFDPVIQEWTDFRCQTMADALRQMASYAKSLNPEVAIEINCGGITGANRAWLNGIDHARLLPLTQVIWSEEGNTPGLLSDGRLITRIRSYKLGRAFQNIVLTYNHRDPLAMSEALAFGQTIGFIGGEEAPRNDAKGGVPAIDPEDAHYIGFYRSHRDLFVGTRDAGGVAVLRSYPSLTYDPGRAQYTAILAEQSLIESHVPFELVFDRDLADLSRYNVLVLPNSTCLSDAQLAAIRRFVRQGGGLVAIGQAGLYDQWRRARTTPGLAGLVDGQPLGGHYEEEATLEYRDAGAASRKEAGKGRAAYLPGLRFDGPLPEIGSYVTFNNRFFRRPANYRDLADAVRWAAGDALPVKIDGPTYLVANLVSQPEKRRSLLHLVNYSRTSTPIKDVTIACRAPAKTIQLFSPDGEARRVRVRPDGAFLLPEIRTYTIAVIDD